MAVRNRKVAEGMIFHSDRGVQYASEEFRNTLDKNVVQSMSRKGKCRDNVVAESLFRNLKGEMIYGNRTLTAEQMEMEIFKYIEIGYNNRRQAESLFRNLKGEMIYGNRTLTAEQMEMEIFKYIEIWYNNRRQAESLFRNLKCEMIYGNRTLTAEQMEMEIFKYIEIWYNNRRQAESGAMLA